MEYHFDYRNNTSSLYVRFFGITVLKPEKLGWFPSDDLREYYGLEEHKTTKFERIAFGIRDDGSEGVLFPTFPKDHVLTPAEDAESPPIFTTNPPDENADC